MLQQIVRLATDAHVMARVLVAVAVAATVFTVASSFLSRDQLAHRMKSVSAESERLRARERAMAKDRGLVKQPKVYMKNVVDRFSLSKWLGTEDAKIRLAAAGFRGPQAEIAFLFFRLVSPIGLVFSAMFYLFVIDDLDMGLLGQIGTFIGAAYAGIKAPELFLTNTITKRQQSIKRAFPDALDLMLICVESGMSIDHAFRKVAREIGGQSIALAEELSLASAELSYLPDRRSAYTNLVERAGLDGVKQIATVLIQAEKYGTPLGQALRVTANESRAQRMVEAEKQAASLPPKLTVPMIVFFLPVLMVVVMGPAILQAMDITM